MDIVVDHVGKFLSRPPPSVGDSVFRALLGLLDGGRCWVKLSAPYESSRIGMPTCGDVAPLARALAASHAERCLWGTNWPHPGRVPPPSEAALLDTMFEWAADERAVQCMLVDNPQRLYGFAVPAAPGHF